LVVSSVQTLHLLVKLLTQHNQLNATAQKLAIVVATNLVKTTANVVVKKCAKDVNVSKLIANA